MKNIEALIDKVHLGKWEDIMPQIPDNTVDLIVTSPPYNLNLGDNKFNKNKYDTYDDNIPYQEYLKWMGEFFKESYRVLKSGGRICVNIGDKKQSKEVTHVDFIVRMKEVGFIMLCPIVWNKSQIGNRTAWGSYKSPAMPCFPTPFEYIIVMCKDSLRHEGDPAKITVGGKEFQTNANALWEFPPESGMMKKWDHPACVDSKTEMLTSNGWKKYNEVKIGDAAASFNIESKQLEWNKILNLTTYEHNDVAIQAMGRHLEFVTNKSHKFVVIKRRGGLVVREAKGLKLYDKIPCAAGWNDTQNQIDTCNGVKLNNDLAYLLGFFVADGHFSKDDYKGGRYYGAIIDQSVTHNLKKIKVLKETLARMDANFKYWERDKPYTYKNKTVIKREATFYIKGSIRNQFMSLVGCPQKNIPPNILEWNKELLASFLNGFVDGDGSHRKFTDSFSVAQKDSRWLDILHAIGVRLGYDSFVSYEGKNTKKAGYVEFNHKKYKTLRHSDGSMFVKEINYSGIMWCPFIENNHFFVARRGGRVFITGNCFPEELPRRCIQQLTYADDIVLDPFSGVGTTCAVAKKLRRRYIGIEMSQKYYDKSLARLSRIATTKETEDGIMPEWME